MDLARVVDFFAKDVVDAWDSTAQQWVVGITHADLEAFDDNVRSGEDYLQTRFMGIPGDAPPLDGYYVVRIDGRVYLLGIDNHDSFPGISVYQKTYFLRRADLVFILKRPVSQLSASGVNTSVSYQNLGSYHGAISHQWGTADEIRDGDIRALREIHLPGNIPAVKGDLLAVGQSQYCIVDLSASNGLITARGEVQ